MGRLKGVQISESSKEDRPKRNRFLGSSRKVAESSRGRRFREDSLICLVAEEMAPAYQGDPQSMNAYMYVRGNPVNLVDPNGAWSVPEWISQTASVVAGFLPGLGEAQDLVGAAVGYDIVSGEDLSTSERGISGGALALPFVGGSLVNKAFKGGKKVVKAIKGAEKVVEETADATKAIEKTVKATTKTVEKAGETTTDASKGADAFKNLEGVTAEGQATDKFGKKRGPSGKPEIHKVKHSSKKAAKDVVWKEGKGTPIKPSSPKKGKRHYYSSDAKGKKNPGSSHHEYPE